MNIPRVLIIAGSDSGGGSVLQADLKTISALGAFGMTAITALTAQNTTGVLRIFEVLPEFVALQIKACAHRLIIIIHHLSNERIRRYSTVTDFARLRG